MVVSGLVLGIAILALCLSIIVFVSLLGVMREVVTLRGELLDRAMPPEPAYIGSEVPTDLSMRLRSFDPSLATRDFVLLFLSDSCSACGGLLRGLRRSLSKDQLQLIGENILAVVLGEGRELRDELDLLGIPTVVCGDSSAFFEAAFVLVTPSAMRISGPGLVATEYQGGVEFEWLIKQVARPKDSILDVPQV